MITVQVVERNSEGKRIVKVMETGRTPGGEPLRTTKYVVHAPSRLVAAREKNGRFSKVMKTAVVCPADKATGWRVDSRFDTLFAARQALGINTGPKRPAAVAAVAAALAA